MPSLTVENYIKVIYTICASGDGAPAATGRIAELLEVSPGSVTSMLKTLSESNLVTYTPYEGVLLTSSGQTLALRVLRRHRLIELFLVRTLNLNWDEVHEEAEHMEHAVSDLLVDRIEAYLGYPATDPHGDPIPRADGSMQSSSSLRLADCGDGQRFRLTRVLDQEAGFLRYLTSSGLAIEAEGQVIAASLQADTITVRVGDREATLGRSAAEKLLVERV